MLSGVAFPHPPYSVKKGAAHCSSVDTDYIAFLAPTPARGLAEPAWGCAVRTTALCPMNACRHLLIIQLTVPSTAWQTSKPWANHIDAGEW